MPRPKPAPTRRQCSEAFLPDALSQYTHLTTKNISLLINLPFLPGEILESPLDSKEIKLINPIGNEP